jgi:integrase
MLVVNDSGSKQFVQRIMFEGRRTELGLGSPPVVTLPEARDRALDNKRLIRSGHNPVDQKRKRAAIPTFKEAAKIAGEIQAQSNAASYKVRFDGSLTLHAYPSIGEIKVSELTSKDIFSVLKAASDKSPDIAKKLKNNIAVVVRWAMSNDYLTEDPLPRAMIGLPKSNPTVIHRKSLDHSLVNGLIEDLRCSDARDATKLSIEFLILTAGRSGEIRYAVWDEINFAERIWSIPAGRMKSIRDHKVPLSDRALEILRDVQSIKTASKYIFTAERGGALPDALLSNFVKKTLMYDVDVHGFRASFRTWAQEHSDCKNEVAEWALSHVVGNKIEKAYARSKFLPERRVLLQAWADYLKIQSSLHSLD